MCVIIPPCSCIEFLLCTSNGRATTVPANRGRTFVDQRGDGHDVYVVVNDDTLPPPPPIAHTDLFAPQWAFDKLFYLAFLPVDLKYQGPVFGCLNYTFHTLPIVESSDRSGQYCLDKRIQKQWLGLERYVEVATNNFCAVARVSTYVHTWAYHAPSHFNYHVSYKSRVEARKHSNRARLAFSIKLAMLSYCMASARTPSTSHEAWYETVIRNNFMHPEFATAIKNSWVCNWDILRIGAFVDLRYAGCQDEARCTHWFRELEVIAAIPCIPLYILYGTVPGRLVSIPWAQRRKPTEAEIDAAIAVYNTRMAVDTSVAPWRTGTDRPTVLQWLTMQAQLKEDVLKYESRAKRLRREEREAKERLLLAPTAGGPMVFQWVKTGGARHTRHQINPDEVPTLWSNTLPEHRIYNSIAHEYDVCTDLGELNEETEDVLPPEESNESHPDNQNVRTSDIDADAALAQVIKHRPRRADKQYTPEDKLENILYDRYGLKFQSNYIRSEDVSKKCKRNKEPLLYTIIVHNKPLAPLSGDKLECLADFVDSLAAGHRPPSELCDLSPASLHVHAISQRSLFAVPTTGFLEHSYYMESFRVDRTEEPWRLVVRSIAAAQIIRRGSAWGSYRVDVARQLLRRGIPFVTLSRKKHRVQYPQEPQPERKGLGFRMSDYQFTETDYQAYECTLEELLRSGKGRAALQAGGLIWRIAYDYVDFAQALGEPSHSHTTEPVHVEDDVVYVTDVLKNDDNDVICGLYKVYNGKCYNVKLE